MKKLELVVDQEIAKVANWMSLNKLSINYNKTEFMVISNRTKQLKLKLKINKYEIKQKQETKYLGVLIENTLTRKAHIKLVCTKLARGCFALVKLQNLVNLSTLKSSVPYKRKKVRKVQNFFQHFRTEILRIPVFFLPPKTGVFVSRPKP